MSNFNKFNKLSIFCLFCIGIWFGMGTILPVIAQGAKVPSVVEKVTLGPHPEFSRIMIHLSDSTRYEIKADFMKRRVTLILNNSVLGPEARSRIFRDRNLERVQLSERQDTGTVDVTLQLKNRNSRFFHFLKTLPNQIVVDVKGVKKPFIKTRFKLPKAESLKIPGYTQAEIAEAVIKDQESKLKDGWDDYLVALKTFQDKRYSDAVQLFAQFQKRYPKSKYLSQIAYLNAQAAFNTEFKKVRPVYERPLAAYNFALREYPDSPFADHAKTRVAYIYDDMNMVLEAKTLYRERLQDDPKGLFAKFIRAQLALLLIKEDQYAEAFDALKKILKTLPNDFETREGILKVGKWYYDQENFPEALKVFDYIERQGRKDNPRGTQERFWQKLIAQNPEINFYMGEIYFRNKDFKRARTYYFDLINLDPLGPVTHKSRNRIGDSYFIEGNDQASLAVFDESAKDKLGGRESQYGLIRMADIGVRNPNLSIKDISVNVKPYFHPFKTYESVIQKAQDNDILAEALLSRGIAYLRSQRYLNAMDQFKLLLAMKPASNFIQAGEKYLKQSLILVTDKFSRQNGNLPILYAYGDYLGMGLGDIDNVKTLLQVAEAYQHIGMYQEAVHHYERVKIMDTSKTYSDRIFLNLGKIHLIQGNYKDAERVSRAFINRFPKSKWLIEAKELLAESQEKQNRLGDALNTFEDILKERQGDSSRIHFNQAKIYETQNQLNKAAVAYQSVINTYDRKVRPVPKHVTDAYYRYGASLYNSKKYLKAIEAFKRARGLFPNHPSRSWADFLLTEAYDKVKNLTQAATEMRGIVKSPDQDDLLKKVAEAKLKILDWEKQFKDVL